MITSEKLVGSDNYLSWSASVELWFMGQGYEDHLITQEADIPQAKGLYTNDIQCLYQVASTIVHISQQDLDLSTYIGQIASLKEEFLTVMPLTPDVGLNKHSLITERKNRHLVETARTILFHSNVPFRFWGDAVSYRLLFDYRMPSSVLHDQIPHSLLFPDQPLYFLPPRVFGCTCFVHILTLGQDKLSAKAMKCLSWDIPNFRRVIVVIPLRLIDTLSPLILAHSIVSPPDAMPPRPLQVYHCRPRVIAPLPFAEAPADSPPIPSASPAPALPSPNDLPIAVREKVGDRQWWIEMTSLHSNGTWDLVVLPSGKSTVGYRWVYAITSARLLLSMAAMCLGLFISWILKMPSFMVILPRKFIWSNLLVLIAQGESGLVCKLRRSLYGLKQSPRAWFDRFSPVVQEFGMLRSSDQDGIQKLKQHLFTHFQTKDLGKLKYFLGIEIAQSSSGVVLFQRKYALDILEETDADWAGSPTDRRSTSGYCVFIGGNLISWKSKKQDVVARSSAEAEYRAMTLETCELIWLKHLLRKLRFGKDEQMKLICDNQTALHIASNPVFHERTKHIEVGLGKILKRGRGFPTRIKFGERDLAQLLEVREVCFKGKSGKSLKIVWNEDRRGYKLELRSNNKGHQRFLWWQFADWRSVEGEPLRRLCRLQKWDTCSGFVAMDEETMERHNLQWAKIHVKSNGKVSMGKDEVKSVEEVLQVSGHLSPKDKADGGFSQKPYTSTEVLVGLLRMGHDLFSSGLRGLLFKSNKGVSGKVKNAIKGLRGGFRVHNAVLVEAVAFAGDGDRPLIQSLGDNRGWENKSQPKFLENVVEGPFCKGITVESEEQGFSKLKSINWLVGEQLLFDCLFSKLVNFSSYVGMLVIRCEKEIICDSRVCTVNIIWISPDTTTWIRNPCKSRKGELALDIVLEKAAVKQRGDAWRIVLDACLPVLHLIDTRRSIPYAIKQVQELLGISCAFDQAVQRLSKSVTMVAKGVLKEHLILFGKYIVASCSWGKHVTVGTGSRFDVLWDTKEIGPAQDGGIDIYSFLHLVRSGSYGKEPDTACLGAEVEDLILEDENLELGMSPEHSSNFEKPVFEDSAEFQNTWENHVPDSGGDWAVNQNKETTASTLKPSAWSSWGTDKVTMKDTFSTREPDESSRSAGWDDKGTWGTDKAQNTAFRRTHEDSPRSSGRDETFRDGRPQFASSAWGKKIDEADKTGWNKNDGKPQMDKLRESYDWDCKVAQEKTTQSTYGGISSTTGDWKKNELQMEVVQHDESPVNEHSWDANLPEDPLAQATTSVGWDSSTGKDWTKRKLQSPSEQQRDPAIKSWSSSHNVMKEQSNQPASTHGWDSPGAKGWNDVEEQSQWNQRGSAVKNDQSESSHGWGPSNEQNQLPSSQGWGSPNAGAGHESETQSQWGQPSGKKSRPEGSRGWGSNNTEWKNKKNRPNKPQGPLNDDYSAGGIFTATRQRVDIFTSEEQDILLDVEPIMQSIRRIMHQAGYLSMNLYANIFIVVAGVPTLGDTKHWHSGAVSLPHSERTYKIDIGVQYNDGDPLSADDQSYILDKVFNNHPDKAVKMGTGIDYVMPSDPLLDWLILGSFAKSSETSRNVSYHPPFSGSMNPISKSLLH
ncbi:DNA-directed RNA polymerase V subunit 1 [Vitis vinifera]|uniref:DNA-directed RNA polymerase V subunit 1 n=1 Tax=Vitis vinifera TaxID=29760 RepID=A0A438GAV2_VITVI|nr:DNA-directed RNA polymerase V subunit 1 [Vitis vinifera]